MEDSKYRRLKVIKARSVERLFTLLDNERRPYELVVHTPIAGTRVVTIKATNEEDTEYFANILNSI